jgi:hypothetical protein
MTYQATIDLDPQGRPAKWVTKLDTGDPFWPLYFCELCSKTFTEDHKSSVKHRKKVEWVSRYPDEPVLARFKDDADTISNAGTTVSSAQAPQYLQNAELRLDDLRKEATQRDAEIDVLRRDLACTKDSPTFPACVMNNLTYFPDAFQTTE